MRRKRWRLPLAALLVLAACGDPAPAASPTDDVADATDATDTAEDVSHADDTDPDDPDDADATVPPDADTGPPPDALTFRVMTMNIGTTVGLPHDLGESDGRGDGYTAVMAAVADTYYGNGLSWNPAEAALTAFLARERPTVVVFQEGFFDRDCESIPVDPELDFVCRDYSPERPLQIERLLGPDYQTACADGQDDNCLGVLRDFATIEGCPTDAVCLGGLTGQPVPDCGHGARIGRAELALRDGRRLVVVNVHGTSGIGEGDQACRAGQFAQIFVDRGDGRPAADGDHNLVMGDLNTDPVLFDGADASVAVWRAWVGRGRPFHYISSPGEPKTYAGAVSIDHVVSDTLQGSCVVPGATGGVPPVLDAVYWDHKPVLCDVWW